MEPMWAAWMAGILSGNNRSDRAHADCCWRDPGCEKRLGGSEKPEAPPSRESAVAA